MISQSQLGEFFNTLSNASLKDKMITLEWIKGRIGITKHNEINPPLILEPYYEMGKEHDTYPMFKLHQYKNITSSEIYNLIINKYNHKAYDILEHDPYYGSAFVFGISCLQLMRLLNYAKNNQCIITIFKNSHKQPYNDNDNSEGQSMSYRSYQTILNRFFNKKASSRTRNASTKRDYTDSTIELESAMKKISIDDADE